MFFSSLKKWYTGNVLGVMYTNRRMTLFIVLILNKAVKSYPDYGEQEIPNSLI